MPHAIVICQPSGTHMYSDYMSPSVWVVCALRQNVVLVFVFDTRCMPMTVVMEFIELEES